MGVKWYLIVVLVCVSLINDVAHPFMWWVAIVVSFGEMSVQILCSFLSWVVCYFVVELWCILDISLLSDEGFADIFLGWLYLSGLLI